VAIALLVIVGLAPCRRAPQDSPYVTRGTPSPATGPDGEPSRAPEPMTGVAPWAMSAVPDCFEQTALVRGTRTYVDARLPSGFIAIPDGAVVRSGDCTVRRVDTALDVRRGDGLRLEVPAVLRFATRSPVAWDTPGRRELLLVVQSGPTLVARRYETRTGATIAPAIRRP